MKEKDRLSLYRRDPGGGFVYCGAYVTWQGENASWKRAVLRTLLLSGIPAALLFFTGCLPLTGLTGQPLLLLPFGVTLLVSLLLVWNFVRLFLQGTKAKIYIYDEARGRTGAFCLILMIAGGFTAAALLFTLIRGAYTGNALGAGAVLFSEICTVFSAVYLRRGAVFQGYEAEIGS